MHKKLLHLLDITFIQVTKEDVHMGYEYKSITRRNTFQIFAST